LSHRFWAREFGSSASVVGSTLSLQGQPFTVVGVMPQHFFGTTLDSNPDLWLPLSAQPLLSQKPLNDPEPDRHFSILARLRGNTPLAQAQAEFAGVYRATQKVDIDADPKEVGVIAPIEQGSFALREQFSHALTLLLWGLAMLLLMVCANVAGLLLAKAVRSERDTAVRMALGASRGRLLRRALVESTILGLAGALGGLLVAYLCAPLLMHLLPTGRTPLTISLIPDWKIDLLAIGLSLIISLLFGGFPHGLHLEYLHSKRYEGARQPSGQAFFAEDFSPFRRAQHWFCWLGQGCWSTRSMFYGTPALDSTRNT
jgi:hypothetical protein